MAAATGNHVINNKEHQGNPPGKVPGNTTFAYNSDNSKTPGGIKVRFKVRYKVRIITGPAATRWDTRQTEAIKELLTWLTRHQPPPAPGHR